MADSSLSRHDLSVSEGLRREDRGAGGTLVGGGVASGPPSGPLSMDSKIKVPNPRILIGITLIVEIIWKIMS